LRCKGDDALATGIEKGIGSDLQRDETGLQKGGESSVQLGVITSFHDHEWTVELRCGLI
jgi:hypothetical protein